VKEGAVAVSEDGVTWRKVESPAEPFALGKGETRFLKVGKRFVKVVVP
jgi:hypothetical protein